MPNRCRSVPSCSIRSDPGVSCSTAIRPGIRDGSTVAGPARQPVDEEPARPRSIESRDESARPGAPPCGVAKVTRCSIRGRSGSHSVGDELQVARARRSRLANARSDRCLLPGCSGGRSRRPDPAGSSADVTEIAVRVGGVIRFVQPRTPRTAVREAVRLGSPDIRATPVRARTCRPASPPCVWLPIPATAIATLSLGGRCGAVERRRRRCTRVPRTSGPGAISRRSPSQRGGSHTSGARWIAPLTSSRAEIDLGIDVLVLELHAEVQTDARFRDGPPRPRLSSDRPRRAPLPRPRPRRGSSSRVDPVRRAGSSRPGNRPPLRRRRPCPGRRPGQPSPARP